MEFLQPASLEEALSLFAERPAYTILAGGTDHHQSLLNGKTDARGEIRFRSNGFRTQPIGHSFVVAA